MTPVLQRYGVSDDDAFAVGLTCGGILDIYVEKIDPTTFPAVRRRWSAAIRSTTPVAVVTCVAARAARSSRPDAIDGDRTPDPAIRPVGSAGG